MSPATPLPNWSLIFTTSGEPKAALVCALWALPLDTAICVAAPEVAVAVKPTGEPVAPLRVAVADCCPDVWPSVHVVVAMPVASVTDFGGFTEEPAPTAAHATESPATGAPLSVTRTRSGFVRLVATVPVCAFPLAEAVIAMSGTGAAVAVAVKVTGEPVAPANVAVAFWVPAEVPRASR